MRKMLSAPLLYVQELLHRDVSGLDLLRFDLMLSCTEVPAGSGCSEQGVSSSLV